MSGRWTISAVTCGRSNHVSGRTFAAPHQFAPDAGTVPFFDIVARPSDLPGQAFPSRDLDAVHLLEPADRYSSKGVRMVGIDDSVDLTNIDIKGNHNSALSWDFLNCDGNLGADTASEGSHASKMIGIMAGRFAGIAAAA